MSVITDKNKCTGCKGLPIPKCVENCPGDLMLLGEDGKSKMTAPGDCWDCMVCVKACPHGALTTKLSYQLANYKATLTAKVRRDRIHWTSVDVHGEVEEFDIRTLEV